MTERVTGSLPGDVFTQAWLPDGSATRGLVVLVHGFGEHSDRYDHVATRLADAGFAVHALDLRGHGRSAGRRAVVRTDALVADLDALVGEASAAHPGVPVFVLGHSMGGMVTIAWAVRHGSRCDGLILSGPLAGLDAPPLQRRIVAALAAVAPGAPAVALDPALVSRRPDVVDAYRSDPLVHHGRIPAATVAEMLRTTARFPDQVAAITVPTLIVHGTADELAPPWGARMVSERIGSDDVTVHAYDGLYHEVFNEPERETVLDDVVGWLDAHVPA